MKINKDGIEIDDYDAYITRYCESCNNPYKIIDINSGSHYFYMPYDYASGCRSFCLHCWLIPDELPPSIDIISEDIDIALEFPTDDSNYWYDESYLEQIDLGDLKIAYKDYIRDGFHLVVMPISRLVTHRSVFFPNGMMVYPEGRLNLDYNVQNIPISELKDIPVQELTIQELSSLQSHLSGVSIEVLNEYPLIVLPLKYEWDMLLDCSHEKHIELISNISEFIDSKYLNFIKYKNCHLEYMPSDNIPSAPSQTLINNMSASLFINGKTNDAKLVAGAVFSHQTTKGLGLVLSQPEWPDFPKKGEVSKLVYHSFSLYNQMIQTQSATSRFVQALSLLEFLAYPTEYKTFKEVKKVIARYIVQDTYSEEYKNILNRFEELTGKIDDVTGEQTGLRTRIIHIGAHLEEIVPLMSERKKLFQELDEYIRSVIDHMIDYSHLSLDDYLVKKSELIKQ